jgi:hypothetical protein
MKLWLLLPLALLAGCHKGGGAADPPAVVKAEALIKQQVGKTPIGFLRVQPTGDADTGQVCGYFTRKNALGGTDAVRFIVFADGNNGENPFIDQPSSPFPIVKSDFAVAWAKLCVKLGYQDGDAPAEDKTKKKKKRY